MKYRIKNKTEKYVAVDYIDFKRTIEGIDTIEVVEDMLLSLLSEGVFNEDNRSILVRFRDEDGKKFEVAHDGAVFKGLRVRAK